MQDITGYGAVQLFRLGVEACPSVMAVIDRDEPVTP
jgi:hypothetical protein